MWYRSILKYTSRKTIQSYWTTKKYRFLKKHYQIFTLLYPLFISQFSSVSQSCQTLCNPMDCSMPGFPICHQLLELIQIHVHPSSQWCPSPPTFKLSQHQGLLEWVSSSYQVSKVLELHLQSFQWTFRTDYLGLISLQSKGLFKSLLQHHSSKASILQHSASFIVQL